MTTAQMDTNEQTTPVGGEQEPTAPNGTAPPDAPAPEKSPQEQLAEMDGRIAAFRGAIAEAVGTGEDFTELAAQLTACVTGRRALFRRANADKVNDEKSRLGQAIYTLVQNSQLSPLMDEPVRSVFFELVPGEGDNGDVITLTVNGARRAPTQRSASAASTAGTGTRNGKTYSVDGGEALVASNFVATHAPQVIQENKLVAPDENGKRKFPSKPVFIEGTIKHLEETGHTVVVNESS